MICQECKDRPATLHFTKIVNGEKTEVHLCEQCAQGKGDTFFFNGGSSFSIHDLLAGILNVEPAFQKSSTFPSSNEVTCEGCHMSYAQFTKIGRFGCSYCYKSFEKQLDPILKRLHGGNVVHAGKIPKRTGDDISLRKKLATWKKQLKDLIHQEEFEKAAELRDEIRSLEREIQRTLERGRSQ
ncbi:UvrB/UvrC motif-containing protein [Peribacillus acanthi]|uniref:UvrB/UvrC motif-containing protein n=1 Tax=Peribacillus acanthi TaxID=2171554 RepID=UPI000D3E3B59|nr:UvrB/UvrC motif-containing protein [Peribacillus acanthi]